MRTVLRGLGRTLPAGAAMLMLAACGGTATPTTPGAEAPTVATAPPQSSSGIVRGLVVDAANRPVANANVECGSNAQCTLFGDVSAQDGPDEGVKTNADGLYRMIVTPSAGGGFVLNASARGYGVAWQEVRLPDAACTWDQPKCAVTVNFTLTAAE